MAPWLLLSFATRARRLQRNPVCIAHALCSECQKLRWIYLRSAAALLEERVRATWYTCQLQLNTSSLTAITAARAREAESRVVVRVGLAVVIIADHELVQVTAGPAPRPKQHAMQAVQFDRGRHREAPPDERLDAEQFDPQLMVPTTHLLDATVPPHRIRGKAAST